LRALKELLREKKKSQKITFCALTFFGERQQSVEQNRKNENIDRKRREK
jgi:hypothetical protein